MGTWIFYCDWWSIDTRSFGHRAHSDYSSVDHREESVGSAGILSMNKEMTKKRIESIKRKFHYDRHSALFLPSGSSEE